MLGRKNLYGLRVKLPPMKDSFLPKLITPEKRESQHSDPTEKRKSDFRGTNTLAYSETVKQSDANTLFKFTERHTVQKRCDDDLEVSQIAEADEQNANSVARSQHHVIGSQRSPEYKIHSNVAKSDFMNGKFSARQEENQKEVVEDKSVELDDVQAKELYTKRRANIPEFNNCWFEFFNDEIYCNISSLVIHLDGHGYNCSFGVAKVILASISNMTGFLQHSRFGQGKFEFDQAYFESISDLRAKSYTGISVSEFEVQGKHYKLEQILSKQTSTGTHLEQKDFSLE